jgi:uncharacterized lipoprotein YehR (DUF1307 family)
MAEAVNDIQSNTSNQNNRQVDSQATPPTNVPQVTSAEVSKWEDDFRKTVSPQVQFTKQNNGYSMKFYNGQRGMEAVWSGSILLKGDNAIKWTFSMTNGPYVEVKMNLDEDNSKILANMYAFYVQWQKDVSTTISEPKNEREANKSSIDTDEMSTGQLNGPENANASLAQTSSTLPQVGQGSLAEGRTKHGREKLISESSERMKRLAGLR